MGCATAFFLSYPWALDRDQKVKHHLISITKSISKIFIPNFVCVLTNERYKTYQMGFLFYRLGHTLGVGLGGCLRAKIKSRPAVCPLCYFLLNHWTTFNQIWCVSYSYKWGVHWQIVFCLPPGEGSKGQISFNFVYKVNFKDFIPNSVCVLTNERYKTYQTEFLFCCLGHAPGLGLWGAEGAPVIKKLFFFKHGHLAY